MRKILSLFLSVFIIVSLVGCGTKKENTPTDSKPTDSKTETMEVISPVVTGKEAYDNFLEIFDNKKFSTVLGRMEKNNEHILSSDETSTYFRYLTLRGTTEGKKVNIMQITDLHFNRLSQRDLTENNPAVISSHENRSWCRDEASLPQAKVSIAFHKYFDATAITGDTVDYLTWGTLDMVKENIWDVIPNVVVPLGGHDITRVMQGKENDPTTLESRYEILQNAWNHNIKYDSKIINDRVMMISINNGTSQYYGDQEKLLKADVEKARKKGLTILLFQHEPIATNNKEFRSVYPLGGTSRDRENFQKGLIGARINDTEETQKVYKVITESADVIKGVFCGHLHENYYTEIKATGIFDGKKKDAVIPQIVLTSNAYNPGGNALAITVQ